MFCDESAANERVGDRRKVWGPKGVKRKNLLPVSRSERYSILPALTKEGFLCEEIVQGSFTTAMFFFFIRDTLLPRCNPYPARHSVLVMDNAQIHRHPLIRETIESAGCKLVMLPPYSPDFNPIELAFGVIKRWITRHYIEFAEAVIEKEMDLFFSFALSTITEKQAEGFFRHCKYI